MQATKAQNQAVFNMAARHLLDQMEQSATSEGVCLYRGANGLACAVGCLIEPSYYSEKLEGEDLYSSEVRAALRCSLGFDPELEILMDLRQIHDETEPDSWRGELYCLASALKLSTESLEK